MSKDVDVSNPEPTNTRALVRAAADRILIDQQDIPTTRSILDAIGQGSMSTIADALRDWKADLGARLAAAESVPGVPENLACALVDAWRATVAEQAAIARANLATYQRDADQQVEAANSRVQTVQTALDATRRQVEAAVTENEQLNARIRVLEKARDDARERVVSAETRNAELKATLERVLADAETALNGVKADLALERTRSDATEQRWVKDVESLKQERDNIRDQLSAALNICRAKLAETQEALAQRVGQMMTLQHQQAKLEQRVNTLEFELTQHREAAAEARAVADETGRHRNALQALLERERAQWRADLDAVRATVAQRDQRIAELTEANTAFQVAAAKATTKPGRDRDR